MFMFHTFSTVDSGLQSIKKSQACGNFLKICDAGCLSLDDDACAAIEVKSYLHL
jgi:hypothetical protein